MLQKPLALVVEDEDESSSPWAVAELERMLTPGTVIEVIALEAAEAELKPEASTFKSSATEPFRHLLVAHMVPCTVLTTMLMFVAVVAPNVLIMHYNKNYTCPVVCGWKTQVT